MTEEKKVSGVKQSKTLYAVAVYGFIAMFVIILFPFLPFYEGSSLFESGIRKFNDAVYGNLIVTISMLIHSIALIVIFIVMVSKIRNYGAGVGYSFYKLFKNTIITFISAIVLFTLTGNEEAVYTSYGLEYWYIILGFYGFGLLFCLIAQLANPTLRPSKAKALYFVLRFAVTIFLLYFLSYKTSKVVYYIIKEEMYGSYKYLDEEKIRDVLEIYEVLRWYFTIKLTIITTKLFMPLSAPFSYMYSRPKKSSKFSPLSMASGGCEMTISIIFFFAFSVVSATDELLGMLLLMVFAGADLIAVKLYNKFVSEKVYQPANSQEFKGFFANNNNATSSVVNGATATTTAQNGEVLAWRVDQLVARNEHLDFKDKTSIDKMCDDLYLMLNDGGIMVDKEQTQKILSSILSSKVTFVKSSAKPEVIKNFSNIIAEFFGDELFFEKRINPDEEEVVTVNSQSQSVHEVKEVAPVVNQNASEVQSSTEQTTADEEVAVKENDGASAESEIKNTESQTNEDIDSQPITHQPQSTVAITEARPAEQKKGKTEREMALGEKYSVASGMFVANYMKSTFGMIFVDNTAIDEVEDADADIISAIVNNDENVFLGKNKYVPETSCNERGVMKIADNLRLMYFINEHKDVKIEPDWIKYSAVLELPLTVNNKESEGLNLDCGTSYSMVNQSLEEAQDNFYLTEDYWRKIDRLEEYLIEHTNIRFDNRFIRIMENNIAAAMACGMTRMQALDMVLSEKIIPLVATEKEKILSEHDADFSFKLDELFGFENIPVTKQELVEYGLKK